MARKNLFITENDTAPTDGETPPSAASPLAKSRPLMGKEKRPVRQSSALGAISQSLGAINQKAQRAEEIERKLAAGQVIVELDPNEIDASFVPDRMEQSQEDHERLVASINESGQQVPILVRVHPEDPQRYQVAYGHRRLRAVKEIGKTVKAVVRDLTDEQLVIAQGQENNERTNLTFIERARFAARLEERGLARDVIMQAIGVDKGMLSRMISTASRIPVHIIEAIGSAPSIGQRRWQEFSELLDTRGERQVREALSKANDAALVSDQRFEAAYRALKAKQERKVAELLLAEDGVGIAKYTRSGKKTTFVIDDKSTSDFGRFVLSQLEKLYADFKSHQVESGRG